MTSDRVGGGGLANFWPKEGRLRNLYTMNSDKGDGVQTPKNLSDVIYVRPLG